MTKPFAGSPDAARALWIAPEAPYPLRGGGSLRSAAVFEYLKRRYEVDSVLFREPDAPAPSCPGAARMLVIDLPSHSRALPAKVIRNTSRFFRSVPPLVDRFAGTGTAIADFVRDYRYAVGVIEHFWCAPYWEQIAPHCSRTVLDLHNIESEWHDRCAAAEAWPFSVALRGFARACRRLEREWLPRYSILLAASAADAAKTGTRFVYPNTIPYRAEPSRSNEAAVVFSGNMEYLPNRQALHWFGKFIWPLLESRHRGLRWLVVGRQAARFAAENAEPVDSPDDAVAEIARAQVAVVPLLSGSGTRLKIIEAWAAGVPVVSTAVGAEGLGAVPGTHLLIADRPAEFAHAVGELLASEVLRNRIGRAGRELYEKQFTWEAGWKLLCDFGL
jgi:glycosyltransferase involved in cell wall biosynthesis